MSYARFRAIFFAVALLASSVMTILVFRPYLTLLAFGGVLAIVSAPLYRYLRKILKSELPAAFLTTLFIAVAIILPMTFFVSALASEAIGLFSGVSGRLGSVDLGQILTRILPASLHSQIPQIIGQSYELAANLAKYLSSNLLGLFSDVFSVLFNFLVVLIVTYYLLKDGTRIRKRLLALSPLADQYDEMVFQRVALAVRAVMGGVLIVGIIKAVLAGFFFWVFGVPAPLFWGMMTGFASFLPVFGSGIVTIPVVLYLLMSGHVAAALGLAAVSVVIIGTVDNFLQPKLVENKTRIHPLLILLAILGGFKFYGFSGFILGPLTLAVTLALFSLYEKEFKSYIERAE